MIKALRPARRRRPDAKLRDRWQPGHRRARGAAAGPTPATSRSTWSSCSPTSAGSRPTSARAWRSSSTRCRTSAPTTSRRCAPPATRSASRGCRVIVVGAGLPHLPAVLSRRASPTPSGSSATSGSTGSTGRPPTGRCARRPRTRTRRTRRGARRDVRRDRRLPLLHPGLRQDGVGRRAALARSPRTTSRSPRPRPSRAGGRVLRVPLRAGDAGGAGVPAGDGRRRASRPSGDEDARRGRVGADRRRSPRSSDKKPQSLSPARDALLKKGLIYSGERGRIAFTVPHFGRYLRANG